MLKDITGIRIQGANFGVQTSLQLFVKNSGGRLVPSGEQSRICLLYGKNGSGKSTIAHAFSKAIGKESESIILSELIDSDGNMVQLTDDEKNKVYVFDEAYVDSQVRFNDDGLDTVVMLGETGAIEDALSEARTKLDEASQTLNDKNELYAKLVDETNPMAPKYWMNKMANQLRGEGNWAEREFKIKQIDGQRRAPSVTEQTFLQFIRRNPTKRRDELLVEFLQGMEELKSANSGIRKIAQPVKYDFSFSFDEESFNALLALKLEEPVLSDRERFLFSVLEARKQPHIHDIKSYFEDSTHEICPFCLQYVSQEHKTALFASIEKVLNEAVKAHQRELVQYRRTPIAVSFDSYGLLDKTVVEKCKAYLNDFNLAIQLINDKIEEKLNNIYTPIIVDRIDVVAKFNNLIASLEALEQTRLEYNAQVSDVKPIQNRLQTVNSDIAYYDIRDSYEMHTEKCRNQETVLAEKRQAETAFIRCKDSVSSLEAQKENIEIAKNTINQWLRYVFFSEDRLSLEYRDNKYYLKSRGQSVSPDKISVGERNAIALCYFFSELMKGKSEQDVYADPCMIIIDDPISSFDIDNRVGMLSFLKYQLQRYLRGNKKTKAIVMTHDIQTFFDIQKIADSIVTSCSIHRLSGDRFVSTCLELNGQAVSLFKVKNRQEYTYLLNTIYKYASTGDTSLNAVIGNSMRRVLEAFGTFVYRKGIDEITANEKILGELEPGVSSYFENLLYRLVLNGDSHMKERVQSMTSMDFFSYISDAEKQRTAKDVLCLLYCLNKRHVLEHLGDDNEADIESWVSQIRQSIGV